MSIEAAQLQRIAALIYHAVDLRTAVGAVRTEFPALRAQQVDALDVKDEAPAFQVGKRRVYLVACDGHCWQLTRDPALAGGVLLAQA